MERIVYSSTTVTVFWRGLVFGVCERGGCCLLSDLYRSVGLSRPAGARQMSDEEGMARADPRIEYISARVQATFPKMVVGNLIKISSCCAVVLAFYTRLARRCSYSIVEVYSYTLKLCCKVDDTEWLRGYQITVSTVYAELLSQLIYMLQRIGSAGTRKY